MSIDTSIEARAQSLAAKYAGQLSTQIATYATSQVATLAAAASADGLNIDASNLPFQDPAFIYNGLLPYMQKAVQAALTSAAVQVLTASGVLTA